MENFIAILHKLKVDFEIIGSKITVPGSLDLEGTQITQLPDNLSVGGSIYFDVSRQLTSVSAFRENCGNHNRTIYAVAVGDQIKCRAGCFCGPIDEFISRVNQQYSGDSAKKYIAEMQACVEEVLLKISA